MPRLRSSSRLRSQTPRKGRHENDYDDDQAFSAASSPEKPSTSSRTNSPTLVSTKTNTEENDTSLNFFYKPHTISALVVMLAVFIYVALWVTEAPDTMRNVKIGLTACVFVLIIIGMLMFRDGPFIRPHPVFWRAVLAAGAAYQLFLVFLLFQSRDDARKMMALLDPTLGVPLPERSYSADCTFSFKNIWSQVDEFVLAHTLGWWGKALMLRDYWICWILSVMFEIMEYSLEHQLPNFSECWWDHWLLDVFGCNWLGLYLGMKTCQYLEMKQYTWRGIKQIPTYSGKVRRAVAQFTPYSWTKFEWGTTKNFKHFFASLLLIIVFLQGELNAFYLKYLLWVPPRNMINSYRLMFYFLTGSPAIGEVHQYLTDKNCKRLGSYAWVSIANIMTETLICIKFGKDQFPVPAPRHVVVFWGCFLTLLSTYVTYQFAISPWLSTRRK